MTDNQCTTDTPMVHKIIVVVHKMAQRDQDAINSLRTVITPKHHCKIPFWGLQDFRGSYRKRIWR